VIKKERTMLELFLEVKERLPDKDSNQEEGKHRRVELK
jgi:hypothetical protein